MKKICKVLAAVVLIFGFIGSGALAVMFGVSYETVTSGMYHQTTKLVEHREWGSTLAIFFSAFVSVVILSVILFALSEVLERLENLESPGVRNTVTPTVTTDKTEPYSENSSKWKCSHCNTINDVSVKRCWCGQKRQDIKT